MKLKRFPTAEAVHAPLFRVLPRQGSRRAPFGKFRRYVQYGAVNKCGLRPSDSLGRSATRPQKHVERSTSSRLSRHLRSAARASTAPSIVTVGGDAGLSLEVRDRNPAQRILNGLADHVQLVVAR